LFPPPRQANANLKAETTDVLLGRRRNMHMTAFRYRLDEIAETLKVRANTGSSTSFPR
jgi:hypothetical protein